MKRVFAGLCALLTVAVVGAVPAVAVDGTLPGGTAISVEIATPADGQFVTQGTTSAITGTAMVAAGVAVDDTTVVYALDVSGSTADPSGLGCGTILQCEVAGVIQANTLAADPGSPVANVGVATFPGRTGFPLGLVPPTSGSVATALGGLVAGGQTSFGLGLQGAAALLSQPEAKSDKIIVFVTDGDGQNVPGSFSPPATIKAFAIGGSGCSGNLAAVVALGQSGSSCEVVTNLDQLGEAIGESIGSTLDSVAVTVDDVPVATTVEPVPPQDGPVTVNFSASLPAGLDPGPYEICAAAAGTDAGGSDGAVDCVTVQVADVAVDCGAVAGNCVATATDPGVADAQFTAPPGFGKVVAINANSGAPGECGGDDCLTGFDVLFDDTGNTSIAKLTVTTQHRTTLRQRLNAAVFIDGVEVTDVCGGRILEWLRERRGIPQPIPCRNIRIVHGFRLEYTVMFAADPPFRFR